MSLMSLITSGLGKMAHWLTTYQFGVTTDRTEDLPPPPPQIPGGGIFTGKWSPLITKGLGTSACCGLVLAGLGSYQCFVGITPPPFPGGGGGGGGSIAVNPGIYVPWPKDKKYVKGKRVIVVTVKMRDKKYTRNYLIDDKSAPAAVRVINFVNRTSQRISVGVAGIQRAVVKVRASFDRE